jgi:hypothetical protein
MKVHSIVFIILCLFASCTKFDGASPTSRNSLIHFYGTSVSHLGVKAVPDADGGFVMIGNIKRNDFVTDMIIIKTDNQGHTLWQTIVPSSSASDIKILSDGYLIAGDSIEYQPNTDRISEIVNTRAMLIKVSSTGDKAPSVFTKEDIVNIGTVASPVYSQIDFHGSAMTFDDAGDLVLLGSYKSPETGSLEKSFLAGIDPSSYSLKWLQTQEFLQKRDYINSRALHKTSNNNLLWATTSQQSSQSVTDAYLSVVYTGVGDNSTFKNNSKYGENSPDHFYTGADMQPSSFGFGVVGSYARTDNSGSNIYFVRVDDNGYIQGDAKYFDGGTSLDQSDNTSSQTEDSGNAIVGTLDGGYVIAGSVLSTPDVGNGGTDIVLIKIDAFGGFIWSKLIGGSGDEIASSIRETPEGNLLVCGTNRVNGLSTIFIMKTDKNGELTN